MTESNPIEFFKSFGFDQRRAEETAKNSSLTKNLISILKEAQKSKLDLKDDLNLLYTTATNLCNISLFFQIFYLTLFFFFKNFQKILKESPTRVLLLSTF